MSPNDQQLHGQPTVQGFFERRTFSVQCVVADPETKRCAIIDPVLDFDPKSGVTATHSADALLTYIERKGYELEWILDTHPHADHFSAAGYLKDRTGVSTANRRKDRRGPETLARHLQHRQLLSHRWIAMEQAFRQW